MEYSLHRELKLRYADEHVQTEVRLGRYRIDVVRGQELVEIQHGSLSAIRDKIRALCESHAVLVVKPIVVSKQLVKRARKKGRVTERRTSPKRGKLLDLFAELVFWTKVFPHPNLTLEAVLVDVEEWRHPGHGRRRWRRAGNYVVEDQKLLALHATHPFRTTADLAALLPAELPSPFHSGHVAKGLRIPRSDAQRILYCLRKMAGVVEAGKERNTVLYTLPPKPVRKTA